VSLNVEVMWLLRGLKPHFRTSATAKLTPEALNTTEVLHHPAIPWTRLSRAWLGQAARHHERKALVLSCSVALGCPRTQRVRGQNNVGICFRGYSGPQTVVYSG
jgi:hypothetical protein